VRQYPHRKPPGQAISRAATRTGCAQEVSPPNRRGQIRAAIRDRKNLPLEGMPLSKAHFEMPCEKGTAHCDESASWRAAGSVTTICTDAARVR